MKSSMYAIAVALAPAVSASVLRRLAVSPALPSGWAYKGCYTDNVPDRVLRGASYADGSNMTQESCVAFCDQRGYSWAGIEYAQECYCDYSISNASTVQPDSDCNMACKGDSTEACGAGNRLTVFSNGGGPPTTNPGPNGWQSLGCYTDSGDRTLSNTPNTPQNSSTMTVAICTSACQSSGYNYAGVEYGGECYCGTRIGGQGSPVSDGCNMICNGNHSEYCGGSSRLNLYQLPQTAPPPNIMDNWSALGCWTDNVDGRTLTTGKPVPGGYTNMTIENCLQVCQDSGFVLAGLEYSQECYCGNSTSNGGACATDPTTCNMPCRGNTAEICGGSNRLNIYQYLSGTLTACSPSATSTTATSASSTSTTTVSTTSSLPSTTSTSTSSSTVSSTSTSTTSTSSTSTSTSTSSTSTSISSSTSSSSTSTSTTSSSTSTTSTTSSIPTSTSTSTSTSATSTTTSSSSTTTSVSSTATTSSSSTTTSVSSTTTSSTSSSSSSTSSSSTSAAPSCTVTTGATSYGNVINGGFESGLLPWTVKSTQGIVNSTLTSGAAYAGCAALSLIPASAPGTIRQVTLSQTLTPVLVPGRIYFLTMYQGRPSSALTFSAPTIAIRLGTTTITVGPSCSGLTCTLAGTGGTVWQRISVPFVSPTLSTPLSIVVSWTDANVAPAILFDEISIKQNA